MQVWLRLSNLSPFQVTCNSVVVEVWCNGRIGHISKHEQTRVPSMQREDFLVEGMQSATIQINLPNCPPYYEAELKIKADCRCRIREFELQNNDTAFVLARLSNVWKRDAA